MYVHTYMKYIFSSIWYNTIWKAKINAALVKLEDDLNEFHVCK